MSDPVLAPHCDAPGDSHCHLCGDTAVVGRVTDLQPTARTATVLLPSGAATVAVDLVDVTVGDDVLVHLGFAIERVEFP